MQNPTPGERRPLHPFARAVASALRKRWARTSVSLAISACLLWLAFRSISVDELVASLRSASPAWVLAALGFYVLELCFRAWRWWRLVAAVTRLRFGAVVQALLVGYAANNVLPARLGDLFRADFAGRQHRVSRLSLVGTIVVERVLDMAAVTVAAGLGVIFFVGSGAVGALAHGVEIVAIVLALAFMLMYLATTRDPRRMLARFPGLAWRVGSLIDGLRSINRPRLLVSVSALSGCVWFCNGLEAWALLNALGVELDWRPILLLIGVAGIASAIPSAPANIGTLQFAFVTVLRLTGYPPTAGFAAALLIQVVLLGSVTVAGAIAYAAASPPLPAGGERARE